MKNSRNKNIQTETYNKLGTNGIDTFERSSQTMRCKTKNNSDIRKKEMNAINQALYNARKYRNKEYNSTIADIKKVSKDNKLVHNSEKRFSPLHAFNYTFGNDEDTKRDIEKELTRTDLTKTRTKKLKKQLKDIIVKIEKSKLIDQDKLDAEIAERNLLELNK